MHIREAMAHDSLLLINEGLLPDSNICLQAAFADLAMIVNLSMERTRAQFERLLHESGLKLVKVWMQKEPELGSPTISQRTALLGLGLRNPMFSLLDNMRMQRTKAEAST